jgi:L-ascorbate metabolism protein UlaG (beta-lactamase superfamily)
MDKLLDGITWLGHASFKIAAPGVLIYVDPWKLKGAEKADLILITHEHHDHLSVEDVQRIRKADTTIVTTATAAKQLTGDVRVVKAGDTLTVKGVRIQAVAAYNPAKQFHPRAAGGLGFLFTVGGRTIYHAGDTDATPEMSGIKTDVALVPVGGKYTMTASEAAQAVNIFRPQVAAPMHWGDIIGARADAERFKAEATVPVEILEAE